MKEVGAVLGLTPRTIAFHKYRIMEAIGVKTNAELIQFAVKNHVVAPYERSNLGKSFIPRVFVRPPAHSSRGGRRYAIRDA